MVRAYYGLWEAINRSEKTATVKVVVKNCSKMPRHESDMVGDVDYYVSWTASTKRVEKWRRETVEELGRAGYKVVEKERTFLENDTPWYRKPITCYD